MNSHHSLLFVLSKTACGAKLISPIVQAVKSLGGFKLRISACTNYTSISITNKRWKQRRDVIGDSPSPLVCVRVGAVVVRARTLTASLYGRSIDLRPSFISPCDGPLCFYECNNKICSFLWLVICLTHSCPQSHIWDAVKNFKFNNLIRALMG